MSDHGHPGWYSWLVVIGGALVSMVVSVGISVSVAQTAIDRERERDRQASERAAVLREAGRDATCLVIKTMADVYTDPAPVTVTGEKAAQAWTDLGRTFGCKE